MSLSTPSHGPDYAGSAGSASCACTPGQMQLMGRVFPCPEHDYPDALTAEIRRHLAGLLLSVEIALSSRLGQEDTLAEVPSLWDAVQAKPSLCSGALMGHLRRRASIALLMRGDVVPAMSADDEMSSSGPWLTGDADQQVSDAASALLGAEDRWIGETGEGQPMRLDLPREYFIELVWIAAAVTLSANSDGIWQASAPAAAIASAARSLIDGYDDRTSPPVQAAALASLLSYRGDASQWILPALRRRSYFLFAILGSGPAGIDPEKFLDLLLSASLPVIGHLCRAVPLARDDYARLLLNLRLLHPGWSDASLVDAASDYDALTAEDTGRMMAWHRLPEDYRQKLILLRHAPRL